MKSRKITIHFALVLLLLVGQLSVLKAIEVNQSAERKIVSIPKGDGNPLKMWYKVPAETWNEALAVGNGRLGAMVFGQIDNERMQLNDVTVWSGKPQPDADRPQAYKMLPVIRQTIRNGMYDMAETLCNDYFTCKVNYDISSYQTLGNLDLNFNLPEGECSNYKRWLDIGKAVTGTEFMLNGVQYKREVISSYPDKVIAVHLWASKKSSISLTVKLSRIERAKTTAIGNNSLLMKGNTSGESVDYEVQTRAFSKGGSVRTENDRIVIANADEVTIYLAAGTTYIQDWDKKYRGEDPHTLVSSQLETASKKAFNTVLSTHIADYQKYFNRVKLNLGTSEEVLRPTDDRIRDFKNGDQDPALAMLYYQFGRYLLISSSRPDNPLPSNSQGIWGDGLRLPWNCDYKSNINYQMNYWPAQSANLGEFDMPMINNIKHLVVPGARTAKAYFNAPGWVMAMMTNAWGWTTPGAKLPWGVFFGGSGWTCQQLWEHYAFTRDKEYLKSVYPVMKGACDFYLTALVEGKDGKLITSPSSSPENFFTTETGLVSTVCEGAAMERSIVWDLLNNTEQAARILGIDKNFADSLGKTCDRISPLQIGRNGQLMEWGGDWDDPKSDHRHVSHLFALHPGRQIIPLKNPELAAAAKQTLIERGDAATGWSQAWKMNFWARLRDGDHAYKLFRNQLVLIEKTQLGIKMAGGGTYSNMFDAHPPFQIDGNFGSTAGLNEMLLQSHESYINAAKPNEDFYVLDILPALPSVWANGSITGLRARGGFEVDVVWANKQMKTLKIKSVGGTDCKVRCNGKIVDLKLQKNAAKTFTQSSF